MMARFAGRVALVTGAASGIGRATVERLGAEGARLLGVDVQAEPLRTVVDELRAGGVEVEGRVCDVSDMTGAAVRIDGGAFA